MSKFTRHQLREFLVQLLYEASANPEKTADEILSVATEEREVPESTFIKDIFSGILANINELDAEIESCSNRWKIDRIYQVDKAILRLALYEMKSTETPVKVIINEAVELTKTFDPDSKQFVNGVLNKLAENRGLVQK